MANDFINTITTKDGITYDVQDKRLEVTAADVGKVVSVDESGNLTLTSGGTKLYKHSIKGLGSFGGGNSYVVINDDPNPVTNESAVFTIMPMYNNNINAFISSGYVCQVFSALFPNASGYALEVGKTLEFSFFGEDGQLHSKETFGAIEIITDTVTPL